MLFTYIAARLRSQALGPLFPTSSSIFNPASFQDLPHEAPLDNHKPQDKIPRFFSSTVGFFFNPMITSHVTSGSKSQLFIQNITLKT